MDKSALQFQGIGRRGKESLVAWLFLTPALLALFFFRLLPAGNALVLSFFNRGEFVAFDNFAFLFTSPRFLAALRTTFLFNIVINPLQILISLGLALLLTQKIFGSNLWRIIIFMPITIPAAVSALVWGVAFRPDGLINAVLGALNIAPQPWLTSPDQALIAIMILVSWAGCGYWMVFLIAGLKDIPDDFREAAEMDGANWWQTLIHVILPLMRRPLAFVVVADTVANFLLFAPIQILTQGGPRSSTLLIMYEIFQEVYTYRDFGLAYAEVSLLMIVVLFIVIIEFKLMRSNV